MSDGFHYFRAYDTMQDWDKLNLSNVQLLGDQGAFSTVMSGMVNGEKSLIKVLTPGHEDYDKASLREAQIGLLVSRSDLGIVSDLFVETKFVIKASVLPNVIEDLVKPKEKFPHYYIMVQELIEGGQNLDRWIAETHANSQIDNEITRAVMFQLTLALASANSAIGFQHNDLKGDNIMVVKTLQANDTQRRYLLDDDLFEIDFPEGTPIIKIIDLGAAIIYTDKGTTPLDISTVYTPPPPLHIIVQSLDPTEYNIDMNKRQNIFDMLAVFIIGTNMTGHNVWKPPGYGEAWKLEYPTNHTQGSLLTYATDSMSHNNAVNQRNLMRYLNGKLPQKLFNLNHKDDRAAATEILQLLWMRNELGFEGDIPHDADVSAPGNKLLEALSPENFKKEIYDDLEGKKDYFTGFKKVVEAEKYRLSFFKRLLAATPRQLREFGAPGTDGGFANALYHPYFSSDSYKRSQIVNPRAYPDAKVRIDIEEPLAFQIGKEAQVRRNTLKTMLDTYKYDTVDTQKAERDRKERERQEKQRKAELEADRKRKEAEKAELEKQRRQVEEDERQLREMKEKEKQLEEQVEKEQEKYDENPQDDKQREKVEELAAEEEKAEEEIKGMEEDIAKEKEEIEKQEEEVKELTKEVATEEQDDDAMTVSQIMEALKESFVELYPLITEENAQALVDGGASKVFSVIEEGSPADKIRALLFNTEVKGITAETTASFNAQADRFENVKLLKAEEMWEDKIFRQGQYYYAWKVQRFVAIICYLAFGWYQYFEDEDPGHITKAIEKIQDLNAITKRGDWEAMGVEGIKGDLGPFVGETREIAKEKEEEKEEEEQEEEDEKTKLTKLSQGDLEKYYEKKSHDQVIEATKLWNVPAEQRTKKNTWVKTKNASKENLIKRIIARRFNTGKNKAVNLYDKERSRTPQSKEVVAKGLTGYAKNLSDQLSAYISTLVGYDRGLITLNKLDPTLIFYEVLDDEDGNPAVVPFYDYLSIYEKITNVLTDPEFTKNKEWQQQILDQIRDGAWGLTGETQNNALVPKFTFLVTSYDPGVEGKTLKTYQVEAKQKVIGANFKRTGKLRSLGFPVGGVAELTEKNKVFIDAISSTDVVRSSLEMITLASFVKAILAQSPDLPKFAEILSKPDVLARPENEDLKDTFARYEDFLQSIPGLENETITA